MTARGAMWGSRPGALRQPFPGPRRLAYRCRKPGGRWPRTFTRFMRSATATIRAVRRPITSTAIRTTCCSRSTSSSGRSSGRPATIVVDTGFDEAMGKKRQREMTKPVRDGLARARHRAGEGRDRHHQPSALRSLRQLRSVPAGALSFAGPRNGLCDRALHVPSGVARAVRGRRRRRHGAQGVYRPCRVP